MLNLISKSIEFHNQHDLTIQPPNSEISLQGSLAIPGDKSISHRALMLGALARGELTVRSIDEIPIIVVTAAFAKETSIIKD